MTTEELIGITREDAKAWVAKRLNTGKTYMIRSGCADTNDDSKRPMQPLKFYPNYVFFRDCKRGGYESFTYGELLGILSGTAGGDYGSSKTGK